MTDTQSDTPASTPMDLPALVDRLRSGAPPAFPPDGAANALAFAQQLDQQDELRHLRDEFILPTKTSLRKTALDGSIPGELPRSPLPVDAGYCIC